MLVNNVSIYACSLKYYMTNPMKFNFKGNKTLWWPNMARDGKISAFFLFHLPFYALVLNLSAVIMVLFDREPI